MAQRSKPDLEAELKKLDRSIRSAHRLVLGWMLLWGGIYVWNFKGVPLSSVPAEWGVFGDFFGGILNPLVAYAAFTWLTKSVRLQKEELTETRRALSDSADAQMEQVKLSALTALMDSTLAEVSIQRQHLVHLAEQMARSVVGNVRDLEGNFLNFEEARARMEEINRVIANRMGERLEYQVTIRRILAASTTKASAGEE